MITVNDKQMKDLLKSLVAMPKKVMAEAGDFMESKTPIDQGNARKKTGIKPGTTTILANYAYAWRLENNYSDQTKGKGITKPTIDYIEKQVNNYVGDL